MSDQVFVFVDNSNVWIEGKKVAGRSKNLPEKLFKTIELSLAAFLMLFATRGN